MKIGVIGAGTMGHGIAQVSAMAGHDVVMRDVDEHIVREGLDRIGENLDGGVERGKVTASERDRTLERVSGTTDLGETVRDADLVIEAAVEEMSVKKEIFLEVDAQAPIGAVVATNTSSLSVTDVASVLDDPGRAVGLHFFNPAHIMPLVEIVVAEQTATETETVVEDYVRDLGKTPVHVTDVPGFASSRLGALLSAEAIRMVQEGVATAADVDAAMRLGYNHEMGPIETADHTGLDVNVDVMEYLREELGERFRPPQLLKRKVRAGNLGKKTGEGFYVWEDGEKAGMSGDHDS